MIAVGVVRSVNAVSSDEPGTMGVLIDWALSESASGPLQGDILLNVNMNLMEDDVRELLRTGLALYLNEVCSLSLTTNDIRGCTI